MRKALLAFAAGLLATLGMTACSTSGSGGPGGEGGGGSGAGKIGVILPDTSTSQRWKSDDPRYLKQAFDAANVPVDIQNAQGDKARFARIADRMIKGGVKVLMIVSLDSESGSAVLAKARDAGVKTIDYDRLTLGGGADYYVSFDNVQVGVLQGKGLVSCLSAKHASNPVIAELNGAPTDNNATLFKRGYDSVLQPLYDEATYTKGPDQPVPDWDNDKAGAIFKQMLDQQPRIRGVLAANDGLAGAVIDILKQHGLDGKVPVTGQDATVDGLRNILVGDQCVTVYKAIKPEAQAAANLAIALYQGQKPSIGNLNLPKGAQLTKLKDPQTGAYLPFVSLNPQLINRDNIQVVIDDGFASADEVCNGDPYAQLCRDHNIG